MPLVNSRRLFIAFELSGPIRDYLSAVQKELRKSGADVKWVEPENIHLTFKFLGNCPADGIQVLKEALTKSLRAQKSFTIILSGLGYFPGSSGPRVVWAGFKDENGGLLGIAAALEQVFCKLDFKKETRPWTPHATLGRLRSPLNKTALIEKINETNRNLKNLNVPVGHISLFESRLGHSGPAYTVLQQINFL